MIDILETGCEGGEMDEQTEDRVHSSVFNAEESVTTAYIS
jgi:hypothetical protein